MLGGSEEFCGVLPFACRSNSSIRAFNSAISASSSANDRLGFRRLASNDFFRDSKRHATVVAEIAPSSRSIRQKNAPGA